MVEESFPLPKDITQISAPPVGVLCSPVWNFSGSSKFYPPVNPPHFSTHSQDAIPAFLKTTNKEKDVQREAPPPHEDPTEEEDSTQHSGSPLIADTSAQAGEIFSLEPSELCFSYNLTGFDAATTTCRGVGTAARGQHRKTARLTNITNRPVHFTVALIPPRTLFPSTLPPLSPSAHVSVPQSRAVTGTVFVHIVPNTVCLPAGGSYDIPVVFEPSSPGWFVYELGVFVPGSSTASDAPCDAQLACTLRLAGLGYDDSGFDPLARMATSHSVDQSATRLFCKEMLTAALDAFPQDSPEANVFAQSDTLQAARDAEKLTASAEEDAKAAVEVQRARFSKANGNLPVVFNEELYAAASALYRRCLVQAALSGTWGGYSTVTKSSGGAAAEKAPAVSGPASPEKAPGLNRSPTPPPAADAGRPAPVTVTVPDWLRQEPATGRPELTNQPERSTWNGSLASLLAVASAQPVPALRRHCIATVHDLAAAFRMDFGKPCAPTVVSTDSSLLAPIEGGNSRRFAGDTANLRHSSRPRSGPRHREEAPDMSHYSPELPLYDGDIDFLPPPLPLRKLGPVGLQARPYLLYAAVRPLVRTFLVESLPRALASASAGDSVNAVLDSSRASAPGTSRGRRTVLDRKQSASAMAEPAPPSAETLQCVLVLNRIFSCRFPAYRLMTTLYMLPPCREIQRAAVHSALVSLISAFQSVADDISHRLEFVVDRSLAPSAAAAGPGDDPQSIPSPQQRGRTKPAAPRVAALPGPTTMQREQALAAAAANGASADSAPSTAARRR